MCHQVSGGNHFVLPVLTVFSLHMLKERGRMMEVTASCVFSPQNLGKVQQKVTSAKLVDVKIEEKPNFKQWCFVPFDFQCLWKGFRSILNNLFRRASGEMEGLESGEQWHIDNLIQCPRKLNYTIYCILLKEVITVLPVEIYMYVYSYFLYMMLLCIGIAD